MAFQLDHKLQHKRNLSLQQISFQSVALKDRLVHNSPIHSRDDSRLDHDSGTVVGGDTLSFAKKLPDSKARLKKFVGQFDAPRVAPNKTKISFSPFAKSNNSSHIKNQTTNDSRASTPKKPQRVRGLEAHAKEDYHEVRNQRIRQLDLDHKRIDASSFSKLRDIE